MNEDQHLTLPGADVDDPAEGTPANPYAPRLDDLDGARIAYIDWGKPNGDTLYESLGGRFCDEFGVDEFLYFTKPSPSSPVPGDLMDEIEAADPDAVVIAIADCGSCNSSAVVDAKTFEAKGIPTVQVITDEFLELNGRISESHGVDKLPVITLDHPTRYHDATEIDAIAERIYWSIHTGLTCEECLRLGEA